MRQFLEVCRPSCATRVLDVGGNPQIWALVPESQRPNVVYLNLPRAFEPGDDAAKLVFGDGLHLPRGTVHGADCPAPVTPYTPRARAAAP